MRNDNHRPVIFLDAGKVLIDYDLDRVFAELSEEVGKKILPPPSLDLDALFFPLQVGKMSWQQTACTLNRALAVSVDPDTWRRLWCRIFIGEVPGMRTVLAELKPSVQLIALSNTIDVHWTYIVDAYPIFGLLDGWIVSYEAGAAKPDAAIYRLAVRRFCPTGNPLFFTDDQPENVRAARSLGWDAEVFVDAADFRKQVRKRLDKLRA